ncbi:MAG: hypothetical protein GC159_21330 [Phycisphaera sp.]|nr:hypothetical protein [Phycisphaera sp.]
MFQESEIICLIVAVPLSVATLVMCRRTDAPYARVVLLAVVFALGAATFTVLEDVIWGPVFNALEHVCYALTGLSLAWGCWLAVGVEPQQGDT